MTDNPYAPPKTCDPTDDTVDLSRNALKLAINSWLSGEKQAPDFEDRLFDFSSSPDDSVRFVSEEIHRCVDFSESDSGDLTKTGWDSIQRLLLVLESDCEVRLESRTRWSFTQLLAGTALLIFACLGLHVELPGEFVLLAIPFGITSMALTKIDPPRQRINDPYADIIWPFASFADLEAAYCSTSFRKQRFPKRLADEVSQSPFDEFVTLLSIAVLWTLLSPIALLFQIWPSSLDSVKVVCKSRQAHLFTS